MVHMRVGIIQKIPMWISCCWWIWMMPIVKNRKNFFKWSDAYPFYKNVKTRGFYCMKQPKEVNV